MSNYSARYNVSQNRVDAAIDDAKPSKSFIDAMRERLDTLIVSHRVNHKVSGALHEETGYARIDDTIYTVRQSLLDKKPAQLKAIAKDCADPWVRQCLLVFAETGKTA